MPAFSNPLLIIFIKSNYKLNMNDNELVIYDQEDPLIHFKLHLASS
jgi:hypothetical protein